jgi:hypothetical protein
MTIEVFGQDVVVKLSRWAATLRRVRLGEVISLVVVFKWTMKRLLKNRLGLIDLELGLEISHMVGDAAAVGAAAGIGEAEWLVCDVIAKSTPIASTTSVFLDLFGIDIGVAALREEAWEMLRRSCGAFSKALVITVVGFVGTSHGWYEEWCNLALQLVRLVVEISESIDFELIFYTDSLKDSGFKR